MRQQTIDQYFIHPKSRNAPAKVSFLSLPFSIRRRIYAELNLPLPQTINLNFSRSDADECEYPCLDPSEISSQDDIAQQTHSVSHFLGTGPDQSFQRSLRCNCNVQPDFYVDWDCRCDNAPYQLLYLTKNITEEVRYVFWSKHTFTVSLTDLGGLDVLYALPDHAVRQMTKLLIRLNVYECQKGFICRGRGCYLDCHPGCRTRGHSRLLSKARSGNFSYVLRKWKEMCEFLAASLVPRRLKLAFICDMEDLDTAKAIVAPMSQLPALKECSIRLGISPIGNSDTPSKLQQLAAKTAMQLTRQFTDKPFHFLDLPRELQLKILGYTDLVASCDLQHVGAGSFPGMNPVTWFERFGIRFNAHLLQYTWRDGSDESIHYNGIKCCHGCSDDYKVCLCRAKHAAYSTSCTCWRMPTAIFQVSHHIREAAESIFYSRNHFDCTLFTDGPTPVLGALSFLNRVPPRMIKYIRHVTIVDARTPVFVETSKIHSRIFGPHWSEVLDIFAREGALPNLNLTFAVSHQSRTPQWIFEDREEWKAKHNTPQKVIDGVMGYCIDLGKVLGKLIHEHGKMRNLFFHLSRPLQDPNQDIYRRQCEREIEKIAMGEGYDSVTRGKFLRRHAWNGYECAESCVACPGREPDDDDFWLG